MTNHDIARHSHNMVRYFHGRFFLMYVTGYDTADMQYITGTQGPARAQQHQLSTHPTSKAARISNTQEYCTYNKPKPKLTGRSGRSRRRPSRPASPRAPACPPCSPSRPPRPAPPRAATPPPSPQAPSPSRARSYSTRSITSIISPPYTPTTTSAKSPPV